MKRYQLLADNSRDIVVLVNLEGRRLYVSPAVQDVLGWTPKEWTRQDAADYMHAEDLGAFRRMLKEMLHGEDRRVFRYRTRHKNGQYLWMEASIRTLPDEITGEPEAFVANVRDISERVESERKLADAHEHLQVQAQRDSLTQLANRRRFDEVLEKEWRRGRRTGNPLALLMVDIDHFKCVNDSYGHRAGDYCLQTLAGILQRVARRPSDLSARYGGEEFAVLLPDVDLTAAMVMADSLCLQVRRQLFEAGVGRSLMLTVSVGVAALVPDKSSRADVLVEAADQALYAAKQAGRDRIMPEYEQELSAPLLHQLQ
jgi:diguanylate cyclase (GGDEF)-like protein/PAS domain S-box-containing protein